MTGTLYATAVHSAVIPYCAEPSPSTHTTGRDGCASWTPTRRRDPEPEPAARAEEVADPGCESRSRLRSASVLDGVSTTAIPSAGHTSASAAIAADPLSGSVSSGSPGAGRGSGATRSDSTTSSSSASSASATSATTASPIGARAASFGSLVITVNDVPSASSGPGMYG